ncbi:response regulator transcription factor [Thermoanaerobacterium thermosaccharolyticum]|jgi:DNA-binding response OmpR family regulator|uniref:Stage 0 sporulation protein A homolog n=3 Tax=Thermoanaerobacterium thermosaccharolyticum TaxID=1517 RepID=D9TPV4_THETC|nr:response regulator transcription factor [Thermoanaerobacterium thermosaccharolyticum]ADL69123.1 two component transcriptional regulator, winged helix family [Thermoanaerobacterium thermosaccharolyticum DSM 571]AGB19253.1 response regulator with CheY-like receiver domain and winged-helix DNA-binding domain [Thermoanaerobacterium thermosaccharolyticum M0795]AST58816.1 two component transcriptional regulator, winged helix family [Thermoanaerobacterium thermosaccharolyticum]KAA5807184.1 response
MKILAIDDEEKILDVIKAYLEREGYSVFTETNGANAINTFKSLKPDLVILDLMLPGLSGEEICSKIRAISKVPILMLTAKVEEDDKVYGFSIGADDYLTKPFSPRELTMRVKAILRRTKDDMALNDIFSFNDGDLVIDTRSYEVKKSGEIVNLTPNEYKLLTVMAQNPNRVFTRGELIEKVMGYDFEGFDRTIDAHIKNLRQKIEDDPKNPVYIKTVYGAGYKFGEENA